jgi:hypothetical protein
MDMIDSEGMLCVISYIERTIRLRQTLGKDVLEVPQPFKYEPVPLHEIVQAVMAAEHLGLMDFEPFEKYMARLFGSALMMDRRRLNVAVLLLVTEHTALPAASSGTSASTRHSVRGCSTTTRYFPEATGLTTGNSVAREFKVYGYWKKRRSHYKKLEAQVPCYAESVKEARTKTVRLGVPRNYSIPGIPYSLALCAYTDPLFQYTVRCPVVRPEPDFIPLSSSWN